MNTLKELGDFVGIPQGSLEVARFGGPRITTLGMVSLLVTGKSRPASMRTIIQRLQNLTPITLEAQIVGSRSGEEPFEPVIRVNASGGITWHTTVVFHVNGQAPTSMDLNSSGGDFTPLQLGPGSWQLVVERAGISNTGFVSLSKTLDTITVSAIPPPPPPPPEPEPITPPIILVKSNGNGTFTLSGSNFLSEAKVTIRVVDADHPFDPNLFLVTTATSEGKIQDFPTGKICLVPGTRLAFSAEDGRIDPANHRAITSNIVTISCPF